MQGDTSPERIHRMRSRGAAAPVRAVGEPAVREGHHATARTLDGSRGRALRSLAMPEYLAPRRLHRGNRARAAADRRRADQHGGLPRRDRARTDRPRLVTSYKDYRRWFGGVFARRPLHAARRERLLRERRQAPLRLPHRRRWRDDRARASATSRCARPVRAPGARRVWVRIQDGSTKDADGNSRVPAAARLLVGASRRHDPFDPFEQADRAAAAAAHGGLRRPDGRSRRPTTSSKRLDRQRRRALPSRPWPSRAPPARTRSRAPAPTTGAFLAGRRRRPGRARRGRLRGLRRAAARGRGWRRSSSTRS